MRTLRNILHSLLFVVVLLLTAIFITLQVPSVQSQLADKTVQWLSGVSDADIHIGSVHFLFFNKLIVNDLIITTQSDTLLQAGKLSVTLSGVNPLGKKIRLRKVLLSDGSFHLITEEGVSNVELAFPASEKKDTLQKSFSWDIRANRVTLERFAYHMVNRDIGPVHDQKESIDFTHMHVDRITLDISGYGFKTE